LTIFSGSTSIPLLLAPCRPSAVAGLIIAIIVHAIKSQPKWSPAHIFDECKKTISPSFTDRNSPSAVVAIFKRLRIAASLDHATPCTMFWPSFTWPRRAVNKPGIIRASLSLKAATPFDFSPAKISSCGNDCPSAITPAIPRRRTLFLNFRTRYDRKPVKFIANKLGGARCSDMRVDSHYTALSYMVVSK
jgi:hypothetical protein